MYEWAGKIGYLEIYYIIDEKGEGRASTRV
jgi:hypothetical protein